MIENQAVLDESFSSKHHSCIHLYRFNTDNLRTNVLKLYNKRVTF